MSGKMTLNYLRESGFIRVAAKFFAGHAVAFFISAFVLSCSNQNPVSSSSPLAIKNNLPLDTIIYSNTEKVRYYTNSFMCYTLSVPTLLQYDNQYSKAEMSFDNGISFSDNAGTCENLPTEIGFSMCGRDVGINSTVTYKIVLIRIKTFAKLRLK
jgi:hypothetical protein